jgi:uncharacterized protein (TIGR00251 family)
LSWYRIGRDGVTLQVQAQSGAKRTEVAGLHGDCVKVRLASPPADGKANEHLIEFLAERLRVKRNQVKIIRGLSSRRKTVLVQGAAVDPQILLQSPGKKD